MPPKTERRKKEQPTNNLIVEYVDLAPEKRRIWLQGLVKLYEYVESIDVDQLVVEKHLEKPVDQLHDA